MCSAPKRKLECELLALLLIYPLCGAELAMQIPQTKVLCVPLARFVPLEGDWALGRDPIRNVSVPSFRERGLHT